VQNQSSITRRPLVIAAIPSTSGQL